MVHQLIDQADYLPFTMRNKPVLREWIRIRHDDAAADTKDAALLRQAARFAASIPSRAKKR